MMDKSF